MGSSKKNIKSLSVQKGVSQPSDLSPYQQINKIKKKNKIHFEELTNELLKGNRSALAKAITLVESRRLEDQELARQLIEKCYPHTGNSMRIGITGVPGAGKSTFIEALGEKILMEENKLAVLAIDPSSQLSRGSILGDKTRMEKLSVHPNAFVRPSPSSGTLGGITAKTHESMLLCEAAGFNIILIETVGVGQSEVSVSQMVDLFMLLAIPGAGDELQGIKRGIMELADAIIINKADGDNINKAKLAKNQIEQALHYFPAQASQWNVPVLSCSSLYDDKILQVWEMIEKYFSHIKQNNYFEKNRQQQQIATFDTLIAERLNNHFYQQDNVKDHLKSIKTQLNDGAISVHEAVNFLFKKYLS